MRQAQRTRRGGEHSLTHDRPTFSVIMPTTGRSTLAKALRSVATQVQPGDEIIVLCNDKGDQGDWARNSGVARAIGTHLVFLDDDDEYLDGALAAMRGFARQNPDRIGIFRMQLMDGSLLWSEPELRFGNVSSQMFVVPNIPEKLGRWDQSNRANDWAFISETATYQGEPVFCEHVVARIRPNGPFESRRAELRFRLRLGSRLRRSRARIRAAVGRVSGANVRPTQRG